MKKIRARSLVTKSRKARCLAEGYDYCPLCYARSPADMHIEICGLIRTETCKALGYGVTAMKPSLDYYDQRRWE